MYLGPLWPDSHEEWIFAYREELEELYAQVVDDLSSRLTSEARTGEAVRLGRLAVLRAPMREQVHTALIHAYAASGQMVEAIRQFEVLEQMLDENWGETPSARSRAALDTPVTVSQLPELPAATPSPITVGGAVHPNSHLYIERQADIAALSAMQSCESVVLLQGPRQVGKTSMLARCLAKSRDQGHRVVLTDFQSLSSSQLKDEEKLYRALCDQLVRSLGLDLNLSELWNVLLGPNSNLDNIVRRSLSKMSKPSVPSTTTRPSEVSSIRRIGFPTSTEISWS